MLAIIAAIIFGLGLLYWGNRFKVLRRTTIILFGILGGGALVAAGRGHNPVSTILGFIAVICAMINVVGGFIITDRMLRMFKGDGGKK